MGGGLYARWCRWRTARAAQVRTWIAGELVAVGRAFIGNPDLGRRLREDLPCSPSDRKTYYGGGAQGYTDYPCA